MFPRMDWQQTPQAVDSRGWPRTTYAGAKPNLRFILGNSTMPELWTVSLYVTLATTKRAAQ